MMNSQTTVEDNNNNNSSSSILYPLAYKKKRYNAPFRIGISSCIIFREHNLQSKNEPLESTQTQDAETQQ
eukprot:m.128403 g.128403  ORF g.128403 m.128403 type:complete len:70 (+) comp14559_c0_seq29:338-547(+)